MGGSGWLEGRTWGRGQEEGLQEPGLEVMGSTLQCSETGFKCNRFLGGFEQVLNLSGPQLPHLNNGDNNDPSPTASWGSKCP